jgi:hypothetical protein
MWSETAMLASEIQVKSKAFNDAHVSLFSVILA